MNPPPARVCLLEPPDATWLAEKTSRRVFASMLAVCDMTGLYRLQ
jgi:hypothetical protein